jgi:hypothetical protein
MTEYFVNYDTNEGRTDSGQAVIRGQAVEREDDGLSVNALYCQLHFGEDRFCYFHRAVTTVGRYEIGTPTELRVVWDMCPSWLGYNPLPEPDGRCVMDG